MYLLKGMNVLTIVANTLGAVLLAALFVTLVSVGASWVSLSCVVLFALIPLVAVLHICRPTKSGRRATLIGSTLLILAALPLAGLGWLNLAGTFALLPFSICMLLLGVLNLLAARKPDASL